MYNKKNPLITVYVKRCNYLQQDIGKRIRKQAKVVIQKITGKKHGDTEITQKETIEATRTKQINRIEHHKKIKQNVML